jgi:hypothetical protein
LAITAIIESITCSEATRSCSSSFGLLIARSRSSTNSASTIAQSEKAPLSAVPESTGRNASSAPIRRGFTPARRI